MWASKITWFFVWVVEIDLISVSEHRNWLDFSVGVGIDSDFVWVVEIDLVFVSGHRHWRNFRVGIDIELISGLGSKLVWLLCGGLGFCGRTKNDLFLVWGSIDLVLYGWSKSTWLLCAGRKALVLHRNWLVFCAGGRNWLDFSMGIELDLISVSGSEDLVFVGGSKMTFFVSGSKWSWFFVSRHQKWLD